MKKRIIESQLLKKFPVGIKGHKYIIKKPYKQILTLSTEYFLLNIFLKKIFIISKTHNIKIEKINKNPNIPVSANN